jgi:hypothetical protein
MVHMHTVGTSMMSAIQKISHLFELARLDAWLHKSLVVAKFSCELRALSFRVT